MSVRKDVAISVVSDVANSIRCAEDRIRGSRKHASLGELDVDVLCEVARRLASIRQVLEDHLGSLLLERHLSRGSTDE